MAAGPRSESGSDGWSGRVVDASGAPVAHASVVIVTESVPVPEIAFLSEVKSEAFVLECGGGELEKLDLTFDVKTSARVIDLLMR